MKMLSQGAEAKLYLDNKKVVKNRISKSYRIKQIDEKIRKQRTNQEFNLLIATRRIDVLTPLIYDVDKKEHKIIMEYIDGKRVKEYFYEANKNDIVKLSFEIGRIVGKLHSNGIIHGDLTTSNMILRNNEIYLIDFGLGFFSKKIEDQGVDLKLMREALKSTHFKILDVCWENFLKGYKKEYKDANLAIRKVDEIERRARYTKGKNEV